MIAGRPAAILILGAAAMVLMPGAPALGQTTPPRPATAEKSKPPAAPAAAPRAPAPAYVVYEPSRRQRLRRESCMRDEEMSGRFCVKQCERGYVAIDSPDGIPRCRSQKPLPPGQSAPPVRKEQAPPPKPMAPAKAAPGA